MFIIPFIPLFSIVLFSAVCVSYDLVTRDHAGRALRTDSLLNALIGAIYGAFTGLVTMTSLWVSAITTSSALGTLTWFFTIALWTVGAVLVVRFAHADTTFGQRVTA